jgi:7-cyano-7-deazaguanine synthase
MMTSTDPANHAQFAAHDRSSPPAVVLLSGGLDSATTLAMACRDGFACHTVSFDYGQRHRVELEAASEVAANLGAATHRCVRIDLEGLRSCEPIRASQQERRTSGGSALIDDLEIPKDRDEALMGAGIPVTYVPARNTIFLSHALALAEMLQSTDVFLGVNAVDYSGYPDCRPQYIRAFEQMANLATRAGVEGRKLVIHSPLIDMTKRGIIETGLELGVDYARTHSCYDPDGRGRPCTRCDACLLRQRAFEHLGREDPLLARWGCG